MNCYTCLIREFKKSQQLADVQGSSRAVMNNSGAGTSAIIARRDYLPFGEEIGSGLGLRTNGQGYNAIDNSRQKFALTERDSITGLAHTWFRKYESLSGRWTSPDPLVGSIANPQSFNRYSYVQNDPVNFIDPTGLFCIITGYRRDHWESTAKDGTPIIHQRIVAIVECFLEGGFDPRVPFNPDTPVHRPPEVIPIVPPRRPAAQTKISSNPQQKGFDACAKNAWRAFRKGYFWESGRAVGGVLLFAAGAYVFIRGIPGAAPIGVIAAVRAGSIHNVEGPFKAGLGAGLSLALPGAYMIGRSVQEQTKNIAARDAGLENCEKQFPNADHSFTFFNF